MEGVRTAIALDAESVVPSCCEENAANATDDGRSKLNTMDGNLVRLERQGADLISSTSNVEFVDSMDANTACTRSMKASVKHALNKATKYPLRNYIERVAYPMQFDLSTPHDEVKPTQKDRNDTTQHLECLMRGIPQNSTTDHVNHNSRPASEHVKYGLRDVRRATLKCASSAGYLEDCAWHAKR